MASQVLFFFNPRPLQKSPSPAALTYDGDGLPGKPESPVEGHVLAPTTGRPQSHDVLKPEEHHQDDLLWGINFDWISAEGWMDGWMDGSKQK